MEPYGTNLGRKPLALGDQIIATGDLDGDGQDELVQRSTWGIGIIRRYPYSNGKLRHLAVAEYGKSTRNQYVPAGNTAPRCPAR